MNNINEIISAIESHKELAVAISEDANDIVEIFKIDEKPIGNELIWDYIYRILGRDIMKHLCRISVDEADSRATFQVHMEG